MRLNKNRFQRLTNGIKAIIFDMDGTLLDSEPLHEKAFNQTLETLNVPISVPSPDELLGVADFDVFKLLGVDKHLPFSEFLETKNSCLVDILKQPFSPELFIQGADVFIEQQENHPKLVVSASEEIIVKHSLEHAQIHGHFIKTFSTADTHFSKPTPAPYLKALRYLGLKSSEVLIFEDSPTGLQAAKASGAKTIRVGIEDPDGSWIQNYHDIL